MITYYQKNKEKIKIRRKKYDLKNKELIYERNKKYNLKNKEKIKEYRKKYNLKNKEKRKIRDKEYYLKNKELISERTKKWVLKNKELVRERSKEYNLKNKEKIKIQKQEYYLKNKELMDERNKKYELENKEKIKTRKKKYYHLKRKYLIREYRLKNKERINKTMREWVRHRRQTDLNFRLRCNLRSRIRLVLRGKNKSASTMELLGCTIEELWAHLESQFEPWMTRENYGLWHVDHIIPCASFDLTDPVQQRECFYYTNLQPLEAIANIKKGNKIISGDITSPKM